jgi:putative DNA primase/helicase
MGRSLHARKLGYQEILATLREANKIRCEPPLDDSEVDRIAHNAASQQDPASFKNAAAQSAATAELESLADIQEQHVDWLWRNRVPRGKLTLLVGDPGRGKSFVSLDIAARVSTGAMFPDSEPCEQGDVIIFSAEDGMADTIVPRLNAAGADRSRIYTLRVANSAGPRMFSLATDLELLRAKLAERPRVVLVVIDPVTAYLGDIDAHKDAAVRALLAPLADLAEQTKVAIVGIMHLNKAATLDVIYRVTGSIAFVGVGRMAWVIAADPADEQRRLLLELKNNLAPSMDGLAFRLEAPAEGEVARVSWEPDPVPLKARDVLGGFGNQRRPRGPKPDKLDAAKALITEALADGEWHLSHPVTKSAEPHGLAYRRLIDAAKALGIEKRKTGFTSGWLWRLPPAARDNNSATSVNALGERVSDEVAEIQKNSASSPTAKSASSESGAASGEGVEFREENSASSANRFSASVFGRSAKPANREDAEFPTSIDRRRF